MLFNMKTCVVPISLYCGVPHSSVLGSLLPHIVYSSHLAKSCHHWQNFHLYADDTLLYPAAFEISTNAINQPSKHIFVSRLLAFNINVFCVCWAVFN